MCHPNTPLSAFQPVISRDVGRVVYMDGAFDVFHSGHVAVSLTRQCGGGEKEQCPAISLSSHLLLTLVASDSSGKRV